MARSALTHKRRTGRTFVCLWLLAALGLVAAGCGSVPYRAGTPLVDEALARELRQSLEAMYPAGFRAVHRVVLSVKGRQFAFTGYLLGGPPGHLRLLASSDVGAAVFEVIRRADGGSRVVRAAPGRAVARLQANAARDAARICFERPTPVAQLVKHGRETVGLTDGRIAGNPQSDGSLREFLFDAARHRLVGYLEARGSRVVYEIAFSDDGPVPGWPRPVPRRIAIADREEGYQADIRVLELRAAAPAADAFKTED